MDPEHIGIAIHLVGLILWVGGTAAAALVAASVSSADAEVRKAGLGAARKAVLYLGAPGLLLAWIAGLSVLVPSFATLYAHAGWMHAKLTLILVLSGVTGVLSGRLRRAAAGTKVVSAGFFAGMAIVLVLGAACVVFLAVLQPGS